MQQLWLLIRMKTKSLTSFAQKTAYADLFSGGKMYSEYSE